MSKKVKRIESHTESRQSFKYWLYLLFALALSVVIYNVYSPIKKAKFTNWDDDRYIVNNQDIQKELNAASLDSLVLKEYEGNYHPVTMISYALNYKQGKLNPQTYLYTNLWFHIGSTLLVLVFVLLITNGNVLVSFVTALLFGIHPMHVESVAWASERKDVLYCFFFFVSLIFYAVYVKGRGWFYLVLSILFFALSLLSKAMAVPLVGVLVLVDLVFHRRYVSFSESSLLRKVNWRVLLDKVPYVVMAIWAGLRAIKAQKLSDTPLDGIVDFSALQRLGLVAHSFVKYIFLLIVPHRLSAFYPYPKSLDIVYFIYLAIVVVFFIALLYYVIRKFPLTSIARLYIFGILFFVFNILLVLQIKPVGQAIMADRYTYVSAIGIFLIVGLLLDNVSTMFPKARYVALILFLGYSVFLSYSAHERCKIWKDSISLWDDVVQKHPNVALAVNNRGLAKQDKGDLHGAFADYKLITEMEPRFALAWNNMGSIKAQWNEQQEAIRYFNKALQLDPNMVNTYANRAKSLAVLNDHEGAIKDYDRYITRFAGNPDIINDRGLEKYHLKKYEEAIVDFDSAIAVGERVNAPTMHLYFLNRGLAKAFTNKMQGAFEDYNHAIELAPNYPQSYFNLGVLNYYVGNMKDGCENIQKAAGYNYQPAVEYYAQHCKK